MNKLSIMACIALLAVGCTSKKEQEKVAGQELTTIEFLSEKDYEFGQMEERDTLYHHFAFRNSGTVPYVINKVEPSCGCLKVTYPKYPVKPGQTDSICFVYDGNGFTPGRFIKSCSIYSNVEGNEPITLIIRGGFK